MVGSGHPNTPVVRINDEKVQHIYIFTYSHNFIPVILFNRKVYIGEGLIIIMDEQVTVQSVLCLVVKTFKISRNPCIRKLEGKSMSLFLQVLMMA